MERLFNQWKQEGSEVSGNLFRLSVIKDDKRMVLFKDGRALIHGTSDIGVAKNIYYSFLG